MVESLNNGTSAGPCTAVINLLVSDVSSMHESVIRYSKIPVVSRCRLSIFGPRVGPSLWNSLPVCEIRLLAELLNRRVADVGILHWIQYAYTNCTNLLLLSAVFLNLILIISKIVFIVTLLCYYVLLLHLSPHCQYFHCRMCVCHVLLKSYLLTYLLTSDIRLTVYIVLKQL